jgi:hypothetical protein
MAADARCGAPEAVGVVCWLRVKASFLELWERRLEAMGHEELIADRRRCYRWTRGDRKVRGRVVDQQWE